MACSASTVFDPSVAALAGVHRVQRVPATEKQGRRHSSTVTVVALSDACGDPGALTGRGPGRPGPVVAEDEVRIDTFRGTGPGGQHRNKTDSCVRMVHLSTGITVVATESRSQHQNRAVAWQRLVTALAERERVSAHAERNATRREVFDTSRSWSWCGWRDEVKGPGGRRGSMRRALAGRMSGLLGTARD